MELFEFITSAKIDLFNIYNNKILLLTLFTFLTIATYTDIKYLKIYDKFNLMFLCTRIVFIFMPVYTYKLGIGHIIGGLISFVLILIPAIALMHKMGGDIKFMTVMGLYLGGYLSIIFLLLACFYNLIYSMISIFMFKKHSKDILIPFAPFFLLSFITLSVVYFVF